MARHCFQEESIAQILNEHFVCVKVDREERPDVDEKYGRFMERFAGKKGWPMSVFLDSNGVPMCGDFYLQPGQFRVILLNIVEKWKSNRTSLYQTTEASIKEEKSIEEVFSARKAIEKVINDLSFRFDHVHGGFNESGGAKFLQGCVLTALFRFCSILYFAEGKSYFSGIALDIALKTLDSMSSRGICDLISGGFHRYSEESDWNSPHFEKMLLDQALMIEAYSLAFGVSKSNHYCFIASKTIEFCLDNLYNEDLMMFQSSQSAESYDADEQTMLEGAFYLWSLEHIQNALGVEDSNHFLKKYCFLSESKLLNMFEINDDLFFQEYLEKLRLYREKSKSRPENDRKAIVSWNALMISALVRASFTLQNERYLKVSIATANNILTKFNDPLMHCEGIEGFAQDYAFTVQATLDLYEVTGDLLWLKHSINLQVAQIDKFWNENFSCFVLSLDGSAEYDSAWFYDRGEPSFLAISTRNLYRLFELLHVYKFKELADRLVSLFSNTVQKQELNLSKSCYMISIATICSQKLPCSKFMVSGSRPSKDWPNFVQEILFSEFMFPNYLIVHLKDEFQLDDLKYLLTSHNSSEVDFYDLYFSSNSKNQQSVFFCCGETCLAPFRDCAVMIKSLKSNRLIFSSDIRQENIWTCLKESRVSEVLRIISEVCNDTFTPDGNSALQFIDCILNLLQILLLRKAIRRCFGYVPPPETRRLLRLF